MQRRSGSRWALFALLPLLAGAAACTDRSPTISGDEFFPGGQRPVTLQATLPAAGLFASRGSFAGYAPAPGYPTEVLVANRYGGQLDAHGLVRMTGFPQRVEYTQGNAVRSDTLFTYGAGRLVVAIDSAASRVQPTTIRIYQLAQRFDAGSATWTTAVDTGSQHVAWTTPGGTPGPVLGTATWTPSAAGDSLVIAIDSLAVAAMAADSAYPGLLVTADEPGSLVSVASFTLRTRVHPKSASPDTAIAQNVTASSRTYVFNPEPPRATGGALEVGGIRSARALFDLNLNVALPACAVPSTCGTMGLRDVSINSVELLLKPLAQPTAFAPTGPVPLSLRTVIEPELGFRAPLGPIVDGGGAAFTPGDTLVAIPITTQVQIQVGRDSLSGSFALLSEPQGNTFASVWFDPAPRLRITYTLPPAQRLP
jgi:hypothetical protein